MTAERIKINGTEFLFEFLDRFDIKVREHIINDTVFCITFKMVNQTLDDANNMIDECYDELMREAKKIVEANNPFYQDYKVQYNFASISSVGLDNKPGTGCVRLILDTQLI